MMKFRSSLYKLSTLFLAASISCAKPAIQGDIIITEVNIVDVKSGGIYENMDVVIINDSIASIVKHEGQLFSSPRVIDGKGQFLIPGLWDMHTHTWKNYKAFFPMMIANGVTGVRDMFGNVDEVKKIRAEILDGKVVGPEIVTSGAIIDGAPAAWEGSEEASTSEKGREIVRKQIAAGVDFVKVYSMLNRDVFLAIGNECKKFNISLSGHVPLKVKLEEAVNAGLQSAEHFSGVLQFCAAGRDEYYTQLQTATLTSNAWAEFIKQMKFITDNFDSSRVKPLIELLRNNNMWMSPTAVVNRAAAYMNDSSYINDPRGGYLPADITNAWKLISKSQEDYDTERSWYKLGLSIMKPMVNSNVKFLAGTDSGNPYVYPGFSLHDELQIFVEDAGFTTLQALQTATINPAIFLRNNTGSIEEGKSANVVMLSANPLADINNTRKITGVVLNGKFHQGDSLRSSIESIVRH